MTSVTTEDAIQVGFHTIVVEHPFFHGKRALLLAIKEEAYILYPDQMWQDSESSFEDGFSATWGVISDDVS